MAWHFRNVWRKTRHPVEVAELNEFPATPAATAQGFPAWTPSAITRRGTTHFRLLRPAALTEFPPPPAALTAQGFPAWTASATTRRVTTHFRILPQAPLQESPATPTAQNFPAWEALAITRRITTHFRIPARAPLAEFPPPPPALTAEGFPAWLLREFTVRAAPPRRQVIQLEVPEYPATSLLVIRAILFSSIISKSNILVQSTTRLFKPVKEGR